MSPFRCNLISRAWLAGTTWPSSSSPKRPMMFHPWDRWYRCAGGPGAAERRTGGSFAPSRPSRTNAGPPVGCGRGCTMERLACVDLPEFPLQLLLARHPEWKRLPAAVVAEDKPQGEILWVSPGARAAGVLPGMRYAQGLSLATGLRAAEVSAEEVQAEVRELADLLRHFSPEVETSEEEPGIFWINAAGL